MNDTTNPSLSAGAAGSTRLRVWWKPSYLWEYRPDGWDNHLPDFRLIKGGACIQRVTAYTPEAAAALISNLERAGWEECIA